MRKPVPYAVMTTMRHTSGSIVPSSASTSARLTTAGSCCATRGHGMCSTSDGRSSVTAYKNRRLATYILMLDALSPRSCSISRNRRMSSLPISAGGFPQCCTNRRALHR